MFSQTADVSKYIFWDQKINFEISVVLDLRVDFEISRVDCFYNHASVEFLFVIHIKPHASSVDVGIYSTACTLIARRIINSTCLAISRMVSVSHGHVATSLCERPHYCKKHLFC